jgi:hypothetical protein
MVRCPTSIPSISVIAEKKGALFRHLGRRGKNSIITITTPNMTTSKPHFVKNQSLPNSNKGRRIWNMLST